MKILRKIGKIIFSIFFTVFLSLLILLIIFLDFLKYEKLKNVAIKLIENQVNITEGQKRLILEYLKFECQNKEKISFNFGINITINCSIIKDLSEKNLIFYLSNLAFDYLYFKNYSCNFKECFEKKEFTYFISSQFYNEMKSYFYLILVLTIFFGAMYFFLIETIENKLLSFGTIFIFVGISYFLIDFIPNFLNIQVLQLKEIILEIKESSKFLLYFLIIGVLLLVPYFILKFKKH